MVMSLDKLLYLHLWERVLTLLLDVAICTCLSLRLHIQGRISCNRLWQGWANFSH